MLYLVSEFQLIAAVCVYYKNTKREGSVPGRGVSQISI